MKLQLANDLKGTIEQERLLEIPVKWASEDFVAAQYLNKNFGNAYDFNQGGHSK